MVVALRARDADRTALLATVARALDIPDGVADDVDQVEQAIYDAVWAAAPHDVVIWLDDAHLLEDAAVAAVADLIRELPANGHIAVATRRPLDLGLARLRAQRGLLEVTEEDLRLDDDEVDRLTASVGEGAVPTAPDTPRHAATAALLAMTGGSSAGIAFLQEEVVNALSSDRLAHLRRLVVLDRIDTDIARELTDDDHLDLDALVHGLPLVAVDGETVRLHDLLRDALASDMAPSELRKIRSLTGDALAARHDYVGAIDAHLAARDPVSARSVARRYVRRPTVAQSGSETRGILQRTTDLDEDSPLLAALRATVLLGSDRLSEGLDAWRRTRDLAAGSDEEIEALALHRVAQTRFLDNDPWEPFDDEILDACDRLDALADRVELAAGAAAHIESQSAQDRRDVPGALAALDGYRAFGEPDTTLMRWQRLTDLGFVEQVGEGLDAQDWARMPPGSEVFLGYAMWLRAEGDPEFAEAAVTGMIDAWRDRGQRDALASTIGTGVPIALACGDVATASARVARLRELDRLELPRTVRTFLAVAEGLLASVEESDEAGARRFAEVGRFAEIRHWPRRPHLLALPFLYLVRPDSRETLDAMRTGPAISQALDAGRALVALRERGDPGPACALAWSEPKVLRNHVLPHHFTELACAADADGHPHALAALDRVPNLERQLRRVADQGVPAAAARAIELLGGLPRRAPDPIRLRVLGSPALDTGGEIDDAIAQRARLAQLLALLATHGAMTRDDVIDTIWGGYDDEDKAAANLRSTIAQAQRLLEPDRPRGVDPSYLRTAGSTLSLHGVTTDVDDFERLHSLARQADTAGTPRVALEHYVEAMELYRGDLLSGHDAAWIVLDRVRLRSLAGGACSRIAELLAARGDTEEAAAWARKALAYDPLSDRAAEAFVGALLANDDRRNAAIALREMLAERGRAGVAPSTRLARFADRLPDID